MAELSGEREEVPWQPAQGEGQNDGHQYPVGALVAARVVLLDGPVPEHGVDVLVEEGGEADGHDELQEEDGHRVHLLSDEGRPHLGAVRLCVEKGGRGAGGW